MAGTSLQFEHSLYLPLPPSAAWDRLRDLKTLAAAVPGASVASEQQDQLLGSFRVALGPLTLTYKGAAELSEVDEAGHRAVLSARGTSRNGSGTASILVTVAAEGEGSRVTLTTDLTVTGKPAQFGRAIFAEVGDELVARVSAALGSPSGSGQDVADEPAAAPEPAATADPRTPPAEPVATPAPRPIAPEPVASTGAQRSWVELARPVLVRGVAPAAIATVLAIGALRRRQQRP